MATGAWKRSVLNLVDRKLVGWASVSGRERNMQMETSDHQVVICFEIDISAPTLRTFRRYLNHADWVTHILFRSSRFKYNTIAWRSHQNWALLNRSHFVNSKIQNMFCIWIVKNIPHLTYHMTVRGKKMLAPILDVSWFPNPRRSLTTVTSTMSFTVPYVWGLTVPIVSFRIGGHNIWLPLPLDGHIGRGSLKCASPKPREMKIVVRPRSWPKKGRRSEKCEFAHE